MSKNNINHNGGISIAEALITNHALIALIISDNNIYDKGIIAITNALITNRTLAILHIYNNNFSYIANEEIDKLLTINKMIKIIK